MIQQSLPPVEDWPRHAERFGWSLVDLAKGFAVSTDTLKRVYTQERNGSGGHSLNDWLHEARMMRATELLQRKTVMETADALKYDADAFSRAFKRYYGCAPRDYFERNGPSNDK